MPREQSEYELQCAGCGVTVISHPSTGQCRGCGRLFEINWPGTYVVSAPVMAPPAVADGPVSASQAAALLGRMGAKARQAKRAQAVDALLFPKEAA